MTRTDSFVAVPSDTAGMRLVCVGVRCYDAESYGDVELAWVDIDVQCVAAT